MVQKRDDNPFYILGITPNSTPEDVKKQYKKRVHETHPDKNPDKKDGAEFKKVVHAYRMLTDPSYKHREEVDNRSVRLSVILSFEQAIFGSKVCIRLGETEVKCAVDKEDKEYVGNVNLHIGILNIEVPMGTMEPFIKAFPNVRVGAKEVTIELSFTIAEHERYKITSVNGRTALLVGVTPPIESVLQGGTIEVPTLFGIRTLRIPAGTQIGDMLLIRNHGPLGDLFVRILGFILPTKDDLKAKPQWKDLEINWEKEQELDRLDQEAWFDLAQKLNKS